MSGLTPAAAVARLHAIAVGLSVIVLCQSTHSTQAQSSMDAHARGLVLEGSHLSDTVGRYFVLLPAGWTLDQRSRGGDLRLDGENHRVTCRFITMPASDLSVDEQFALYRRAQAGVYRQVTKVRTRWGSVGGERAGFLESRRKTTDGQAQYAWNVVTVRASVPYVMDCATDLQTTEVVRAGVEKLITSFRWLDQRAGG